MGFADALADMQSLPPKSDGDISKPPALLGVFMCWGCSCGEWLGRGSLTEFSDATDDSNAKTGSVGLSVASGTFCDGAKETARIGSAESVCGSGPEMLAGSRELSSSTRAAARSRSVARVRSGKKRRAARASGSSCTIGTGSAMPASACAPMAAAAAFRTPTSRSLMSSDTPKRSSLASACASCCAEAFGPSAASTSGVTRICPPCATLSTRAAVFTTVP
mmetsp:Transcript_9760/g.30136  ORF Transcript_9760/g.30136 Transcript_9760/m.30136 type:complete len:220 (-) Transcript_9760:294-953(-)